MKGGGRRRGYHITSHTWRIGCTPKKNCFKFVKKHVERKSRVVGGQKSFITSTT
jgi:hypothetical protein